MGDRACTFSVDAWDGSRGVCHELELPEGRDNGDRPDSFRRLKRQHHRNGYLSASQAIDCANRRFMFGTSSLWELGPTSVRPAKAGMNSG